jgi:hypothetical protein
MKPNTDKTPSGETEAARPLADALFAAEAVAHLRGYEREILPLADITRSMDEDVKELKDALRDMMSCAEAGDSDAMANAYLQARAVLAKTEPRKQP